ncbi:MAG TPA: thioredoxin family protein [Acidimicrobiales bacterium]|nr:thioredoxin family protein [Acidimicrobiales bacterium]
MGDVVPEFHGLKGVDGNRYSLSSFGGRSILVLLFVGNGCPSVKAYGDELNRLHREYGPHGVELVAVNANNANLSPPDTFAQMVQVSRERRWRFPYLKDDDGSLARICGATTTPQAFVFDRQRRLRYRGRLADSRQPSMATTNDLSNALDDLLAERGVALAETPAMGCSIVW